MNNLLTSLNQASLTINELDINLVVLSLWLKYDWMPTTDEIDKAL